MSASLHGKITVAHPVLDEPTCMDSPGRMTMLSRIPTRVLLGPPPHDSAPRMTMTRRDAS